MKKIFIASLAVFAVSIIFWGIYNFNFKDENSDGRGANTNENSTTVESKKDESEAVHMVSEEAVKGFFVDRQKEKIIYYSAENGNVIEIDFDGRNKNIISKMQFDNISEISWSPTGKEAILKIGERYYHHDFMAEKKQELDQGVDTAIWNDDGTGIIYKYFDSNSKKRTINTSDSNGEDWSILAETEFRDVKISPVPKTKTISFWNSPRAAEETSLELINPISSGKKKIFSSKNGADYKWAPNGEKAIVTFLKDSSGKSLGSGIIDLEGKFTDLGVPTIASKTAWSLDSKTCYFASPAFQDGAIMPDDYNSGKISTKDTFWKINTENGERERLVELDSIKTEIDASNISVSSNGRSLSFLNRKDGIIYRLDF